MTAISATAVQEALEGYSFIVNHPMEIDLERVLREADDVPEGSPVKDILLIYTGKDPKSKILAVRQSLANRLVGIPEGLKIGDYSCSPWMGSNTISIYHEGKGVEIRTDQGFGDIVFKSEDWRFLDITISKSDEAIEKQIKNLRAFLEYRDSDKCKKKKNHHWKTCIKVDYL